MKNLNRLLFDLNPTPLCLFDFSQLDNLKNLSLEYLIKNISIKEVNQATFDLYEAKNHEELEKNLYKIIPKESFDDLSKSIECVFSKQKCAEIETINYTLNGKKLDLVLRFTPIKEEGTCILVSATDVSHYKSIIEDNKKLAKLPEANPDIVAIISCQKEIKYLNPAGKEALEFNGYKNIFEILPTQFTTHTCFECQNTNKIKMQYSKENKNYLMKIHPFHDEKECMVTLSDITEFTSIKEEKNLLAKAFEINHQPLIMTNPTGNIIKVNNAVEKIYGYSSDELQGKNTNILNPGREVYRDLGYSEKEYNQLFSNLWKSIKDPEIGQWEDVVINQAKDGSLKWIKLMISTIFDENMTIKNYIAMPVDISKKTNATAESKIDLYKALADLAEMRDYETGSHMKRVGLFAKLIAQTYGMSIKFYDDIKVFAPLHDIGKVGISDSILLAERKLSDEEFEKMKNHTVYGYEILKDKEELIMAAEISLSHHENFNGTGYPHQLKGDDIPLAAHIASIADVYDALRSKRSYKEPWTHETALKEIVSLSGTKFDPKLVKIFQSVEEKIERIYDKLKG